MSVLYHFTCEIHLPSIMREGITRGDVPTSLSGGFNAPWLTSDPTWHNNAGWAGNTRSSQRIGTEIDKNKFRLTVQIPDSDKNLHSWPTLAKELGVDEVWYETLNKAGGGGEENHYVYRGKIPREWILKVEIQSPMEIPPQGAGKGMATLRPEDTFQTGPKLPYISVNHPYLQGAQVDKV